MKTAFCTFATCLALLFVSTTAAIASDCDCPVISCNSCQDQVNLEFYTEKCNAGKKVKSCKKPICADKDPLPATCSAAAAPLPADSPKVEKAAPAKAASKPVGAVVVAVGETSVTRQNGEKFPGKTALKVFEGDTIETGANGKLVVKLNNDNTMNLVPNSRAVVQSHEITDSTHKTLINLMYGTIRSGVKKAPRDAKNDFKIKTPSAVAGVRGTDFVTTYTDKVGITKVETLTGLVELSSPSGNHKVAVPKGTYASYVVPSRANGAIDDEDIEKYVERGHMTEAQKLTVDDVARIEHDTGESADREHSVAIKRQPICSEPQAQLNQCSWRLESDSGRCVRKRCNANGEWAEETRIPAAASDNCDSTKATVGPCDY